VQQREGLRIEFQQHGAQTAGACKCGSDFEQRRWIAHPAASRQTNRRTHIARPANAHIGHLVEQATRLIGQAQTTTHLGGIDRRRQIERQFA